MAQAGVGAAGIAAVTSETNAAATQTRNRAAAAGVPPRMMRNESHPPAKPPPMATNGGIQAYDAACRTGSERASMASLMRGPVGPERIAHHAERVGRDEGPQAAVAQNPGGAGLCRSGRGGGGHAASRPVPHGNPHEAEDSGEDERVAPSATHRNPSGQRRGEDGPEADAGLVDRIGRASSR